MLRGGVFSFYLISPTWECQTQTIAMEQFLHCQMLPAKNWLPKGTRPSATHQMEYSMEDSPWLDLGLQWQVCCLGSQLIWPWGHRHVNSSGLNWDLPIPFPFGELHVAEFDSHGLEGIGKESWWHNESLTLSPYEMHFCKIPQCLMCSDSSLYVRSGSSYMEALKERW